MTSPKKKGGPKFVRLSPAECKGLRESTKAFAKRSESAQWEVAAALYKVMFGCVGSGGERVYKTWGYVTFADYARHELGMHSAHAANLAITYSVFQVVVETPRVRAFARDLPISSLTVLGRSGFIDNDNAEAWLQFFALHSHADVRAARYVVSKVPALRNDPEKALARAKRSGVLTQAPRAAFIIPLSKKNRALAASAANLVRRVMNDDSMTKEACIMRCVEQMLYLVRQGKAGAGWTLAGDDEAVVDQAAE